jgi:ketosteroid isomerase-like protein
MKIRFKKNAVGCLLVIALFVLNSACTTVNGQPANQKVINDYYASYVKKDWNMMRSLLADGFTFTSPNDDHIDLKTFQQTCWPNAYKIKKFVVYKMMVNGDEAFVTTNGWTMDGKLFQNTDYIKFTDGKITQIVCFFGPGISYPNNTAK